MTTKAVGRLKRLTAGAGHMLLLFIALSSAFCILFIFYFIIRDAIPFFKLRGLREFFTGTAWYPSANPGEFGALAIFVGSGLVTLGAMVFAVPLGVSAALCLSDVLPFRLRQWVKPVVEILAAIPSVAFGFFALVILAPQLQRNGGMIFCVIWWVIGLPLGAVIVLVLSQTVSARLPARGRTAASVICIIALGAIALCVLAFGGAALRGVQISSGTNALNVSLVLGIMALPTIVSVSEDALQAVGRELREGAHALGATRAEMLIWIVVPAAKSGICAAVILGMMRAVGETMVVWMASGNAAQIPKPWYNLLQPVRTLTATIAGEMGEADHVTGSARYHVLFAMALCLLGVSYMFNLVSEMMVRRSSMRRKK